VKAGFEASYRKRVSAAEQRSYAAAPEVRKLRRLREGAASSGAADGGADDDDDDVVMTQQQIINFKCPVLQVDMEPSGEMRPVFSTACAGKCVFSHCGIHGLLKRKQSIKCPNAACPNNELKASDLKESKEMVRALNKRAMEAE